MRSTSILFICHCLYGGGAERVLTYIANYLDSIGYKIYIIARRNKGEYPINKTIKVMYFATQSHSRFIYQIRKEIKRIDPKVVIAFEYFYNMCAILSCFGLKKKLIISERNDPAKVGSGLCKDRIRNYLYRFCTYLVCQTPDAKNYFPKYIKTHSLVIPNPLKTNLPRKTTFQRKKEIVSFCRLNKQKNLSLLIDAFKVFSIQYPDYILSIYGNGEEKDSILKDVKQKGLQSRVLLYPASPKVHEKIINAAMYVNCSDYEGLSNSMLEAMAIGLPVICTDCPCGGARMMIQNGINGLLIPVGDCNALADAMRLIASNKILSENLSNQAEKIREELSIDVIGKKWLELVNN